ncbi:hypothetical protein ST201phi2-1p445 [Pseudomonas phage 201phi2-1]|uniref:Uncharacterized protein n=1 Tax=Pseudomonas phage 201phi2-1 TaxID=198110 RepID=B3FJV3_BP201|nr:hypothetical protein ST201phi2-1p445 [Pseudomonas phage 201phi2-1]ABY63268.1 hypothetical protein 201phi2-1p445 [Pseudomonas phage 201phi2-1]
MYPYTNDFRSQAERDASWDLTRLKYQLAFPTKCPHDELIETYCNIVVPIFVERYRGQLLDQFVLNRLNEHLEFYKIMSFATKPDHTIEAKWVNINKTIVEVFYNGDSILTIT